MDNIDLVDVAQSASLPGETSGHFVFNAKCRDHHEYGSLPLPITRYNDIRIQKFRGFLRELESLFQAVASRRDSSVRTNLTLKVHGLTTRIIIYSFSQRTELLVAILNSNGTEDIANVSWPQQTTLGTCLNISLKLALGLELQHSSANRVRETTLDIIQQDTCIPTWMSGFRIWT